MIQSVLPLAGPKTSGKAETAICTLDRSTQMSCPSGHARHSILNHGKSPTRCRTGCRWASSTGSCTSNHADLFSLTCTVIFTTLTVFAAVCQNTWVNVPQSYAPRLNYATSVAVHRSADVKLARTGWSGGWRPSAAYIDAISPDATSAAHA